MLLAPVLLPGSGFPAITADEPAPDTADVPLVAHVECWVGTDSINRPLAEDPVLVGTPPVGRPCAIWKRSSPVKYGVDLFEGIVPLAVSLSAGRLKPPDGTETPPETTL